MTMTIQTPIGDRQVNDLALLTPENGKAIGWSVGAIANINPIDPRIIVSATKPIARVDGSPLQTQDIWLDSTGGGVYHFVYAAWYTPAEPFISLLGYDITNQAADITLPTGLITFQPFVIEKFGVSGTRTGGAHTATAYWTFGLIATQLSDSANITIVSSTDTIAPTTLSNPIGGVYPNSTAFYSIAALPQAFLVAAITRLQVVCDERTGAVGVKNLTAWVQGRWAAP